MWNIGSGFLNSWQNCEIGYFLFFLFSTLKSSVRKSWGWPNGAKLAIMKWGEILQFWIYFKAIITLNRSTIYINQCTMWLSFSKNGIRDSNQISTTAPIFLQFNYFRQNLEENVTFTFYFFSFASNFPCKILWDNKNIDANILIFQIPFSQCCWPRRKKLFWGFFLSIKKSACVPNLKFLRHPQQVFCQ